jgi:hypothetical protein
MLNLIDMKWLVISSIKVHQNSGMYLINVVCKLIEVIDKVKLMSYNKNDNVDNLHEKIDYHKCSYSLPTYK